MTRTSANRITITNVRAVLRDRVLDDATVLVEDETIVEVGSGPLAFGDADPIDGCGMLLLPGLVDSHSDGLEKEISPRRTARFPQDFALGSFESRVRAAGITTIFHGVGYQHKPRLDRSIEGARALDSLLGERRRQPAAAVDHRVLYRFEARDEVALDPLLQDLDAARGSRAPDHPAPVVSFEDHTPGQGQFRDVGQYEAAVDPASLEDGDTPADFVARLMAEAEALGAVRDRNLRTLSPRAVCGEVTLLAHDPEDADDIAAAVVAGASVAEFPVSVEAARAARDHDMMIVMGVPNALRGSSHSGNTSARELIAAGLCDVLASDYLPTSMLAAAFELAAEGHCSLPQAVGLITTGPAVMTGLVDRGRIEIGARADLALIDDRGRWPSVVGVHRAGDHPERRALS